MVRLEITLALLVVTLVLARFVLVRAVVEDLGRVAVVLTRRAAPAALLVREILFVSAIVEMEVTAVMQAESP